MKHLSIRVITQYSDGDMISYEISNRSSIWKIQNNTMYFTYYLSTSTYLRPKYFYNLRKKLFRMNEYSRHPASLLDEN